MILHQVPLNNSCTLVVLLMIILVMSRKKICLEKKPHCSLFTFLSVLNSTLNSKLILLKGFVCPNIISHFYLLIYCIYFFTIFCVVTMNRTETLSSVNILILKNPQYFFLNPL